LGLEVELGGGGGAALKLERLLRDSVGDDSVLAELVDTLRGSGTDLKLRLLSKFEEEQETGLGGGGAALKL